MTMTTMMIIIIVTAAIIAVIGVASAHRDRPKREDVKLSA
jgi:hypothetical protein